MKFIDTPLTGAYVVDPEPRADERGLFARVWCRREFEERGLTAVVEQSSISVNPKAGTLRGMHYQVEPYGEVKLVRCTRGAVYDVIVDLRAQSPTFKQWFGIELTGANRRMLYIPQGLAHGILTLQADTEVYYQMSQPYVPDAARGVRWNDPAFGIVWPADVAVISARDNSYPDFDSRRRSSA